MPPRRSHTLRLRVDAALQAPRDEGIGILGRVVQAAVACELRAVPLSELAAVLVRAAADGV